MSGLTINDVLFMTGAFGLYRPSDQDAPNENGKYYNGFLDPVGNWYIMETTKAGSESSYRYKKGESGYAAAWADRPNLDYLLFDAVF